MFCIEQDTWADMENEYEVILTVRLNRAQQILK